MTARRPWWLVPATVYLAMLVIFLAWSPANRSEFPLDDAWIHRVYARSVAFGHGFAYNAGAQEAGCTSPLWAVLSAPAQWLEQLFGIGGVVWAVKLLGAALGALAIAAVYCLARRLTSSIWPAVVAASLFACEPALMFSALSGMEVTLVICLWLWLLAAIVMQRWRLAAALLGLLPVARPEALLLALACLVLLAIQRRITRRSILYIALPTLLWVAFCALATGHPLPNTYYVKASGAFSIDALATTFGALVQHGWMRTIVYPIIGGAALIAYCVRYREARAPLALLAGGSLAFVLAVVSTRSYLPLGYYWTRWTEPGVLGVAAACALGIALALHAMSSAERRIRAGAIAALALVIVASVPRLVGSIIERAARLGSDGRVIARLNVAPGRWIAAHTPANSIIGANDAGAIRYFGGRTTIDLVGLNTQEIAFHRIAREDLEQRIDWIAIYPVLVRSYPGFAQFAVEQRFSIPREEYTICDCNGPTEMVIGRRVTPPRP